MRTAVLLSLAMIGVAQAAVAAGPAKPGDPYVVIQAGMLLARPGEAPRKDQTVVVHGQQIVAVRDGLLGAEAVENAAGAPIEIIDLRDRFVLPGLMDAHVHLMWSSRDLPPRKLDKLTDEDFTLWTLRNARSMLGAGFTTVREQSSNPQPVFTVRDWINGSRFLGPRILAAGLPVGALGGHGDMTRDDTDPADVTASGLCSGPETCRRAVRMQKKRGADVIKMMATGGFHDSTGTEQFFFFDEMEATVNAAHQLGMIVGTHAYADNAVADAVRAGVDSVEHGFGAGDATLKLMKQRGVFLVPTLTIAQQPGEVRDYREKHRVFERALQIGVPIAFGTDVGGVPQRFAAREFSHMVKAGMAPADALASATVNTARLFRIEKEVGTLEPGKLADIVAVKGSPLENVAVLESMDFVMKSGRVAKRDGRMLDMVLE
jgi:imidazolonepropionase-like amidohydrolase